MNTSVAHFVGDVATFRQLDFDGYKLDSCGGQKDIALWSNLLNSTGRPAVVENCHNAPYYPQLSYRPDKPPYCPFNFYRVSVDVEVLYGSIFGVNLPAMLPFLKMGTGTGTGDNAPLSYPGCWGYPDMLEVGVAPGLHKGEVALTIAEARAHFGAWCIVSSPLVLGLDVRDDAVMDAVWPIISNTEAIAINQAWAGAAGVRVAFSNASVQFPYCGGMFPTCSAPAWEVFSKPLAGGGSALLVLNHGDAPVDVAVDLAAVPLLACAAAACNVRDVWAHADAGTATGTFVAKAVGSHDSLFVTLT